MINIDIRALFIRFPNDYLGSKAPKIIIITSGSLGNRCLAENVIHI